MNRYFERKGAGCFCCVIAGLVFNGYWESGNASLLGFSLVLFFTALVISTE